MEFDRAGGATRIAAIEICAYASIAPGLVVLAECTIGESGSSLRCALYSSD